MSLKKIICIAAICLAGCNAKQSTDTTAQQAPPTPTAPSAPISLAPVAKAPVSETAPVPAPAVQDSATAPQGESTPEYVPPPPQPVVSVYMDPPIDEPPPISVDWAPPPMLVEPPPPPQPSDDEYWIGGYWAWQGNWVWVHGRWAPPARHGYFWHNPYYEHRGEAVIFVNGYWAAPGASFVAPPLHVNIAIAEHAPGVIPGPRPIGPEGVFVPPPPGSHFGLIVPAPIDTSPAVVIGAPPIIRGGMHITVNNTSNGTSNDRYTNVTNLTNITHVTVIAPANATANGQAVHSSVTVQPHLAAAQKPLISAVAPEPATRKPIGAYIPGHPVSALPAPQTVIQERQPPEQGHATRQMEAPAANEEPRRLPAATQKLMAPQEHAVNQEPARPPIHNEVREAPQPREQRPEPAARQERTERPVIITGRPEASQPVQPVEHAHVAPAAPVAPAVRREEPAPEPRHEARPAEVEKKVAPAANQKQGNKPPEKHNDEK